MHVGRGFHYVMAVKMSAYKEALANINPVCILMKLNIVFCCLIRATFFATCKWIGTKYKENSRPVSRNTIGNMRLSGVFQATNTSPTINNGKPAHKKNVKNSRATPITNSMNWLFNTSTYVL